MATLSVEDFLAKARPLNPDYSDDELIDAYHQQYAKTQDPPTQTVSPAPLMTLEEFLPKAKALNPDYDDEELAEAWREKYGARGAREKEQGDVGRGFSTAFKQIPQLARGLEAGAGAIGEKIFGEGGIFTALKAHGIKGYKEAEAEIAAESKPSDSVSEAYRMARAGDPGALVDWLQYGLGYAGGQAVQMLATAGVGAIGGKLALKSAVASTVPKLIAKEQAKLAATEAGAKMTADALAKQAVSNVAGRIGQTAALAAVATGMEGGEIYGDLVTKAHEEGRSLTGGELAKALGFTVAAGSVEFVGDKFGTDILLGKSVANRLAKSRIGNAVAGGTAGLAVEGLTEAVQTPLEQLGKGQDPRTPESIQETVDSSALGALGGTAIGTTGGILNRPAGQADLKVTDRTEPERLALPAPPIYGEGPVYTPTGAVEEVIPGKGRLAGLGPGTQPEVFDGEVIPPSGPRQLTRSPQPGEMYAGRVYGEGPILDVSPLPDVSPVTNASTLDEAIAGAVGVVQGATETAKARAAEFAKMTSRARNEAERLIANAPEKRTGADTPILEGPVQTEQPLIAPGQAFTPRVEPEIDPRQALAEERARMVAQERMRPPEPETPAPQAPVLDQQPLKTAQEVGVDKAYPSVEDLHRLAESKGLQWNSNPVFMEFTRMATGKAHLDALSPVERQQFADTLSKIKAPQSPTQPEAPPQVPLTPVRPEKPYEPVTTIGTSTTPSEPQVVLRGTSQVSDEVPAQQEAVDSRAADRKPKVSESVSDRVLTDAKLFGDSADAQAVMSKGFNSLDRDRQHVVLSKVRAALDDNQILRAIVESVPVDVMNVLVRGKGSADNLLHDPSVLSHRLTVPRNSPISQSVIRFVDALASAVKSVPAGLVTEKSGLPTVARLPSEGRSAEKTGTQGRLDAGTTAKDLLSDATRDASEGLAASLTGDGNKHTNLRADKGDITTERLAQEKRKMEVTRPKNALALIDRLYRDILDDTKVVHTMQREQKDRWATVKRIDQAMKDSLKAGKDYDEAAQSIPAKELTALASILGESETKHVKTETKPAQPETVAPEPEPTESESFSLTSPTVTPAKAKAEDRQTSLEIPPETIGTRPIIGREAQPEEAPLFSKAAQEKDAEQTTLPGEVDERKHRPEGQKIGHGFTPPVKGIDDLGGFLSGMSPMQAAKARAALEASVTRQGKVWTRKDLVESVLSEGATVTSESVVDTAARKNMQQVYDRMRKGWVPTGNENHPETIKFNEMKKVLASGGPFKSERRLEWPDGRFIGQDQISKTALDYAEYLESKKPESTPVDTPQADAPTRSPTDILASALRSAADQISGQTKEKTKGPIPEATRESANEKVKRDGGLLNNQHPGAKPTDQGTALYEERQGATHEPTMEQFTQAFREGLPISGTDQQLIDSSQQFPKEMMRGLSTKRYVRQLTTELNRAFKAMKRVLVKSDPAFQSVSFAALSPDDYYLGVNVRGPDQVVLNPWTALHEVQQAVGNGAITEEQVPEYVAGTLLSTMVHEFTHQQVITTHKDERTEHFAQLEKRNRAILGSRLAMMQRQLMAALTGGENGTVAALRADLRQQQAFWKEGDGLRDVDLSVSPKPAYARRRSSLSGGRQEGRAGPEEDLRSGREDPSSPLDDRASLRGRGPVTHWVTFDPSQRYMERVRNTLDAGSGFTIRRVYHHPTKANLSVLEIQSDSAYQDLDLALNSLSSPLRRAERKPAGLTKGLDVNRWEAIYGRLVSDRGKVIGEPQFQRITDDIGLTFPGMEEPQNETRPTGTINTDHARDRLKASKASLRPYLLGALGLEQLSQVYGRDHAEVKGYNKATQAMEADFVEMSRESEQVVKAWTKLKIPVADQMAQVMEDARFLNFDPDPSSKQEADSQKKKDLRTRFEALPGEAQSTYRLARDFYTNMAEARFQALKERIERAGGTPENTKKLVDRLQIAYEQVRSKVYFPFSRFGENIVVAKKMENGVEKDREVHAFESTEEAQQFATLMKMKGWTVKQTVARQYSVDKEGPASKIVRQIHDIIKELDEQPGPPGMANLTEQLLDSLNQSFLQALPDMSYAKHFIHAKDVKGASKDALRAFAHSALHGAHHISRIRHADRITNALTKLDDRINETSEGDTIEARQVYNELVQRHNEILNPSTHPVSAWLGQLGFTMSLGGVVATGVTNATQVPLVTYPWLGARFGFNKASAALARAYKDFLDPRTLNSDSLFDASKSKLISESERKMLLELARRGRIDLTQTMDLAGLSAQDNLSRVARQVGTTRGKVMRMLGFTFHAPEVMNRQVTALAAFRLEKDKGSSFEEALQRADQAIVDTHFIYEAPNRPRYMSGNVLRVLTLFKQYSQNIAYMYGRAASIWLDKNNATAEERAVAKRQLISMLALQFGAAGALGMPFFGASADILMSVVAAFGDDDEKRDWEVALRQWLDGSATSLAEAFTDDKETARERGKLIGQVVSHGLSRLTPFDMANRLGQQDLFFRAPQREREGRQAAMDWLTSFSGPVVGYAVNGMLGVSDLAKGVKEGSAGFFMRGVEELTPAVIRNGVKALRYAMEDVRTRDQYKQLELRPDETLGQAFGFAPGRVAEMYESITAVRNKEHRAMNQRKTLLQRFARAVQERDASSRQKILEDIRAFNSRNRMFGITSDTLNRSIKSRRQHEAGMERGMYLPGKRRALLEEGDWADF